MLNKINSVDELKKLPRSEKNIQDRRKTKEAEKIAEAINELSEAIQLAPKDFKLYFDRATLKLNFGDIAGARQDFKVCEKIRRSTNEQFEDYPLV